MKEKYIKINNVNDKTKKISLLTVFIIFLSLGIFAYYYYYYKDNNTLYHRNDFTISAAMANANKPGIIITSIIELCLIIYLHHLRNNYLIKTIGSVLAVIIMSIIISILYIKPDNKPDEHIILASIGFVSILLYNFLILSILYLNYHNLWLLILLSIPNILIALALIIAVCVPNIVDNIIDDKITLLDNLFSVGELLLVLLLLVSLILLGFYKIKIKKLKLKN